MPRSILDRYPGLGLFLIRVTGTVFTRETQSQAIFVGVLVGYIWQVSPEHEEKPRTEVPVVNPEQNGSACSRKQIQPRAAVLHKELGNLKGHHITGR